MRLLHTGGRSINQLCYRQSSRYYEASEGYCDSVCQLANRELAYIRGIWKDLYGTEYPSTLTYIDNQACIAVAKMPVFSEKQKHIAIQVCHLRECCSNKMIELRPIGTRFEVADTGTKALLEPVVMMLCNVLFGISTFSELQGM
mmetsp:Transcript_45183/g.72757  ORF Transcript_45183/g.72757 Transcript_45183/m.72757 type:complete len:144 (+) Transcript_45183:219-650(+)